MSPEPYYFKRLQGLHPHNECVHYADPRAAESMCGRTCQVMNGASKGCLYGKQRPKEEKCQD